MDLFVTLTFVVWLAGGLFSSGWLFWLDRERREISFGVKLASVGAWPVMLPVLLHERGDLTGWEAARNALVWIALLSPGLTLGAMALTRPVRANEAPHVVERPAEPLPVVAPPRYVIDDPGDHRPFPSENDKREAVRAWNSGIIYYQKGDYEKARDAWTRCKELDRANSDCVTGLGRIEQSFGAVAVATPEPMFR